MSYEIEVKTLDPQPTISIRISCRVAEIGPILKETLSEVFEFIKERGIQTGGPPFTRYHNFDGTNCDIEAGFPVAEKQEGEGRIGAGELPGGKVISTIHTGPYEQLPQAHDALDAWLSEHNKKSRDSQWESYVSDPDAVSDPEQFRTELIWPIE